jgi:hypothetical protein
MVDLHNPNIIGTMTGNIPSGGGDLVDDTSPQLGGDLDVNGFIITTADVAASSDGGDVDILAGTGGATTGQGGVVNITGGAAVSAVNFDHGGHVNITGGTGDTSGNTARNGGNVVILGGEGRDSGDITIRTQTAGQGGTESRGSGSINIRTGVAYEGDTGSITIQTGQVLGSGEGGEIGEIHIESGRGGNSTNNDGGYIEVRAGGADVIAGSTSDGGSILLIAGSCSAAGASGNPGNITVEGGTTTIDAGGQKAGTAFIVGGIGPTQTAVGGDVDIKSGVGGLTSGDAGDIILRPGAAAGSGSAGAINIIQTAAPGVTTDKLYNVAGALTWDGTNLTTDLGEFTVANLPSASSNANSWALATNASGGRTIVRSDGTNWKVVVVEGATVVSA